MDTAIIQAIQTSLKEHGFVLDAAPETTENSVQFTAANGKTTLLVQLTDGRRAKGQPWELAIQPFAATDASLVTAVLNIRPEE